MGSAPINWKDADGRNRRTRSLVSSRRLDLIEAEGARRRREGLGHRRLEDAYHAVAALVQTSADMVDLETMIAEMDKASIDVRVFSLTTRCVLGFARVRPEDSRAFTTRAPRRISVPDALPRTIMLPMQSPELALQELERAAALPACAACTWRCTSTAPTSTKNRSGRFTKRSKRSTAALAASVQPVRHRAHARFPYANLIGNPHEAASLRIAHIGGVLDDFRRCSRAAARRGSFPCSRRYDNGVATRHELDHMSSPRVPIAALLLHTITTARDTALPLEMVCADRIVVGTTTTSMPAIRARSVRRPDSGLTNSEREMILATNASTC